MEFDHKKANLKLPSYFILASGSPRRKELLSKIIPEFEVIPSTAEEVKLNSDGPTALICENARLKAKDISLKHPSAWVLGADTLVFCHSKPFGKPCNMKAAREMLYELSGREHRVATGVSLICETEAVEEVFADETLVTFKELDDQIIETYFKKVNPLDKAGAYAIQTCHEMIIEKWEGSVSNVIGLPLEKLEEKLNSIFGEN